MAKKLLSLGMILLAGAVITACGKSEDLTYSFEYNKCKTGSHSFDSKEAYCKGLQDSELNNGCASNLREKQFAQECSGLTWNPS